MIMSVSVKHKEVKTGMSNLMTHMINDYNGWSMRGRTVESDTEEFIRVTETVSYTHLTLPTIYSV